MKTFALAVGAMLALWAPCNGQEAPDAGKQGKNGHRFDPFVPEELVETDNKGVKWYRFSERQKTILKARDFDRQAFSDYIARSWPLDRLKTFSAGTKPWPYPKKMGFNGVEFIKVDPYGGQKHRFDSLSVKVTDFGLENVLDRSYDQSERGCVSRYGWLIHFSKGRKDWGIQQKIPISSFGR